MKRAEEGGPFGGDEGRRNNLFSRGATGQTNTVDVLNALASVARYPDADPDRIGMWGHSMGGTITLRAMVVTDIIRAGVI